MLCGASFAQLIISDEIILEAVAEHQSKEWLKTGF
jgi:hypothetical protein